MRTIRFLAVLAVAAGLSACQSATPKTAAEPIASALMIRNPTAYDVNVYALKSAGDRVDRIWLATVPAKGQRTLPVEPRMLQAGSNLVVQTQAIGKSSVWTSFPLQLDPLLVGMLDLASSSDPSGSAFYSVRLDELQQAMR